MSAETDQDVGVELRRAAAIVPGQPANKRAQVQHVIRHALMTARADGVGDERIVARRICDALDTHFQTAFNARPESLGGYERWWLDRG